MRKYDNSDVKIVRTLHINSPHNSFTSDVTLL